MTLEKRISEILASAPKFETEICSGLGYHGSSKGDEYEFTVYKFNGESYYSLDDVKLAYVMSKLKHDVKEIVKDCQDINDIVTN
jgi:hypothetical protein